MSSSASFSGPTVWSRRTWRAACPDGAFGSTRHGKSVAAAVRQQVFARSLKQAVSLPDDLPALVERLMVKRLGEAISIANKAGLLIAGFGKVDELIARGQAAVLIHAADGCQGRVSQA